MCYICLGHREVAYYHCPERARNYRLLPESSVQKLDPCFPACPVCPALASHAQVTYSDMRAWRIPFDNTVELGIAVQI